MSGQFSNSLSMIYDSISGQCLIGFRNPNLIITTTIHKARGVKWAMPGQTRPGHGGLGDGQGRPEPGPPGQQASRLARARFQLWNPGKTQCPGAPGP